MEIGAMLDELREKALKDRNIWQQLMDTRKEKQPLDAFCAKCGAPVENEAEEAPEEDVLETDDLRRLDAVEEQKKADPDDIFVEEDGGDEEKADDGEKTE